MTSACLFQVVFPNFASREKHTEIETETQTERQRDRETEREIIPGSTAPSKGDQNYCSWVDNNGEYVENPRKRYCSESFCSRVTASLAEPLDCP